MTPRGQRSGIVSEASKACDRCRSESSSQIFHGKKKTFTTRICYGCWLARTGICFLFSGLTSGGSSWRLIFGALFGVISGLLPLVLNYVNSQVFPQGKNKVDMLDDAVNGTGAGINSVLLVCSVIPFIFVLRSLCDYLNSYYMSWVALRVLADIRCKLYTHILGQSLEFFNRERSGNLISRVANDTRMAQTALTSISSDLIKQPLTVISAFAVLIHLDWKFTIVSLFLFPVCMVPIVYYGKKVRRQGKLEEEKVGSMMSILQESFAGIRVIKAFAREKREAENFEVTQSMNNSRAESASEKRSRSSARWWKRFRRSELVWRSFTFGTLI